jgi:hypothetical protein
MELHMKNYWLNKKPKLLEGINRKWSRATCAVLLESCRLQNEVGDEEYAAYLKDFSERTKRVLALNDGWQEHMRRQYSPNK